MAVNLVRMFRDVCLYLPCGLKHVGSDCLESYFSVLGGHGMMNKDAMTLTFQGAKFMSADVNVMEEMAGDETPVTYNSTKTRKGELILRYQESEVEAAADLADYTGCDDEALSAAVELGLRRAQARARKLGMKAQILKSSRAGGWGKPWEHDNALNHAMRPAGSNPH